MAARSMTVAVVISVPDIFSPHQPVYFSPLIVIGSVEDNRKPHTITTMVRRLTDREILRAGMRLITAADSRRILAEWIAAAMAIIVVKPTITYTSPITRSVSNGAFMLSFFQ